MRTSSGPLSLAHALCVASLLMIAAAVLQTHELAIAQPTGPAFLPNCMGKPEARPKTITVACADGNMLIANVRRLGWGESIATGLGVFKENTCDPNCAASNTWLTRNVAVIASGLQQCPNGRLAYANIMYIDPTSRAHSGVSSFPCSPRP
jgi:hypothetical protein